MSNDKMLIDATHPEETRVVVLRNGRVEEFDYESAARKLLRGNIYLAKVTRVEPALQAAFVDYGGNRHGFLAFNEIHPDYYQIPVADRQALIEEEAAAEAEEEAAADARADALARRRAGGDARDHEADPDEDQSWPTDPGTVGNGREPDERQPAALAHADPADDAVTEPPLEIPSEAGRSVGADEHSSSVDSDAPRADDDGSLAEDEAVEEIEADGEAGEAEPVEQVGSEDALEEMAVRPRRRPRSYKIHEVIKRRQVILVQVVKEERGNKGAALTTYLSLAGRYTVLMPNTGRGGGISRKITNPQDRKRLKAIAAELEVPEGMGLIIRTAGAARTKQEIKRDFEYLLRLWESVRDLTLQSTAPSLVYEEGNLIKRSIRDLYNKDVEEIVVAGEEAHREAKDFMRMLMPSHAKNVIDYREPEPLFTRFQIERQLNAMFSPYVTLRSGGYLVVNQTEALVAIDVNSGKSTREFSIEETALNTNLEAADEIARQLKLRDLAGLIVIDFIDMEEKRNNRAVERRLKDALRLDRARIQLGRISHFGLMEMSRQRLRTGVLEGSTSQCPHCQGTGVIRSTESVALAVLRGIEDALLAGAHTPLIAMTTPSVALYILNNKRAFIIDMERRHRLPITVQGSDKIQGANFTIEKGAALPYAASRRADRGAVSMDWGFEGEEADAAEPAAEPLDEPYESPDEGDTGEGGQRRRGRRRRQRPGGLRERLDRVTAEVDMDGADEPFATDHAAESDDDEPVSAGGADEASATTRAGDDGAMARRGRRRGRRGGRRGRDRPDAAPREAYDRPASPDEPLDAGPSSVAEWDGPESDAFPSTVETHDLSEPELELEPAAASPTDAPRPRSGRGRETRSPRVEPAAEVEREPAGARDDGATRRRVAGEEPLSTEPRLERLLVRPDQQPVVPPDEGGEEAKPARRGWWQRRLEGS